MRCTRPSARFVTRNPFTPTDAPIPDLLKFNRMPGAILKLLRKRNPITELSLAIRFFKVLSLRNSIGATADVQRINKQMGPFV